MNALTSNFFRDSRPTQDKSLIRHLRATNHSGWLCLEYVWVDWEGCAKP